MRPGWAEASPAPATATALAGLSIAVGELATAAVASARRGEPAAEEFASIDGELLAVARATPPWAN
jgi:hypothetical protein